MARKKFFLTLTTFILLLIVLFANHPRSISGHTSSNHFVHIPIVLNPPEPPVWIGPDGGHIIAIDVADSQPSTVYAGTWGSGVYKSIDGGTTWVWKSQGLAHPYINSIAVDPHNAQIIYTGTYTGKLYKTLDGGEHWFTSSANIQDKAIVYSIAIDPLDSENIFIGTRGISNNGGPPWNGVLYRSTDAGNSWKPMLTDIGGSSQEDWAYAVTLHPKFPHLVYGATHEHGIYRSLNFGRSWEPVNDGISSMSTRGIVVNPNSSEASPILYTGVWKWEGVFRSNNGGENWFPVDQGSKDTRIYSMSINPKDSDIVFASTFSGGVLKTSDGGSSWKITGLENYEVPITAIDPQKPQLLYAGTTGNGLYKSYNAGETWGKSQQGLHATNVSALQISPNNSLKYYAGLSGEGVKQTGDGGQNWAQLGTNLGDHVILGLVMPPNQPQIIYALTETDGLYRCDLGGICWGKISISFPQTSQAAFESGHPFSMPPLLEDDMEAPTAGTAAPALLALSFVPSFPQIAYLGTSGAGVYQSFDGGLTWSVSGLNHGKIISLAVDPGSFIQVFAASETQVWSSANGGTSWIDTGLAGVNIYAVTADSFGNFYAGTSNGIYQFTPIGWVHLGLTSLTITTLAAHPNQAGWLYAGTRDGLRISHNAGQTWENGPLELVGITIRSITFDPSDSSWLFISTATQGVLRMQDSE
jgi:photosystem II stability/assembly factor-like uncharacterized protein